MARNAPRHRKPVSRSIHAVVDSIENLAPELHPGSVAGRLRRR